MTPEHAKIQELAFMIDTMLSRNLDKAAQIALMDEQIKELRAKITDLENKDKQDGDDPGHT